MPSAPRLLAAAAAGAALSFQTASAIHGAVDCGGHYAETCEVCSQDNDELWCNGECMWYSGGCHKPSAFEKLKALSLHSWSIWVYAAPNIFAVGLLMLCYAVAYKKRIVEECPQDMIEDRSDLHWNDESLKAPSEREVGLFDCFKMPHTLLWAAFCTPVLAAKNYHVGKVMDFWPACCLVFLGIFSTFWPVFCCLAGVRTFLSMKLKRNLGARANPVGDFCMTLFCFPCEVGRESIEVDQHMGVTIKCAFEVEKGIKAHIGLAEEALDRTCHRVCS